MSKYMTMGMDKNGCVYGLELTEDGKDFVHNSLGFSTSCVVIHPVDQKTLEDYRDNLDRYKDLWKAAVENDKTEDGLEDWFESVREDESGTVFADADEGYPFKDESFCGELLLDMDNPTVKTYWHIEHNLREYVEDAIRENDGIKPLDDTDKYNIATWESAGWWTPKEPFIVELADPEFLERYYKHLEETDKEFKR